MMTDELVDVIEVRIKAPHIVRVMSRKRTPESAEMYIRLAVLRRGVETHFYKTAPAGKYPDDGEEHQP